MKNSEIENYRQKIISVSKFLTEMSKKLKRLGYDVYTNITEPTTEMIVFSKENETRNVCLTYNKIANNWSVYSLDKNKNENIIISNLKSIPLIETPTSESVVLLFKVTNLDQQDKEDIVKHLKKVL